MPIAEGCRYTLAASLGEAEACAAARALSSSIRVFLSSFPLRPACVERVHIRRSCEPSFSPQRKSPHVQPCAKITLIEPFLVDVSTCFSFAFTSSAFKPDAFPTMSWRHAGPLLAIKKGKTNNQLVALSTLSISTWFYFFGRQAIHRD